MKYWNYISFRGRYNSQAPFNYFNCRWGVADPFSVGVKEYRWTCFDGQ